MGRPNKETDETAVARLEAAGFTAVTVDEFLGLTPEESAQVEIRLRLSNLLRRQREAARMSQTALAERIHSSQSRIAKAEAGHPSVSMDLTVRALLASGATLADIGRVIAG